MTHECQCKFCKPYRALAAVQRACANNPELTELLTIVERGLDTWVNDSEGWTADLHSIAAAMGLDPLTTPNLVNRVVTNVEFIYRAYPPPYRLESGWPPAQGE